MNLKSIRISLVVVCALVTFALVGEAAPNTIRFQGRLTDNQGNPVVGPDVKVKFAIYDSPENGVEKWHSEECSVLTNAAGLFSADIGPFQDPALFSDNSDLYLQVSVRDIGGDYKDLRPRQKLSTVPFAMNANKSEIATLADTVPDNSISHQKIKDDSVDSSKIFDHSIEMVDLSSNVVNSIHIVDGSINSVDIEDATITPKQVNVVSFTVAGLFVPPGAIFMFLGPNCPEGYDEVVELRNRVPLGADRESADPDVPDTTAYPFGSKTHIHNIEHSHQTGVQGNYSSQQEISAPQDPVYFSNPKLISGVGAFGDRDNVWLRGFDHSHQTVSQNSNTSGLATAIPPALTVLFCRRQ